MHIIFLFIVNQMKNTKNGRIEFECNKIVESKRKW